MAAPLTNRQKAYLAMLAKEAFDKCGARSACGAGPLAVSLAEEKFRHSEVARACGREGLRCCSQDHYGLVKSHFLGLLGREGGAVQAYVRQASNGLRVIAWKIVERCREYNIPLAKADGICRQMTHGRGLQEVEETRTLWNVYFKLSFYKGKAMRDDNNN